MMNQAAVEALYSATFAEDYLDVVENMPNEMQRHLSRLREADLAQYREFWCDLDKLVDSFESETTLSGQRQILDKIKKTGIASKRKSTAKASSSRRGDDKDDSDRDEIDPSNFDIDPDEPTYCLCDQVSYGDMVGCDNDLCPIEWFHFNCVQLTSKPKGKWYCPKCRGDKVTVMKPKAQFLKELEKYNKEREMKMDRHNS